MKDQESLEHLFRRLEEKHMKPDVRRSPEAMAELLGDDFMEIGSSGRVYADKQGIIASLQDVPPLRASISAFRVRLLGTDIALTTYRLIKHDQVGSGVKHTLRSSIWKLRDGRWQLVFHQGTPTEDVVDR